MKKLLFILCIILGFGATLKAQTSVALLPIPKPSFYGQNGLPLSGCKIYTYVTGTSTPLGTFTDSTGTVPNPNPVTCDAGGFVNPGIWLIVGDTYRILVQDQFGVQQYIVDGVVGVGGGTLSLFSTPNTWTALQTFSGGAFINGGTLTGTFSGSPAFLGTPQFTTFAITNSTVITNLNAQLWNGTSASAGGALTNGWVPVVTGPSASTWGPITNAILPGSGTTTVNGTACTLGSTCTITTPIVYSTPSISTNASIAATTMTTVGGSNATYRFSFYADLSVVGSGCASATNLNVNLIYQDPLSAAPVTLGSNTTTLAVTNGVLGQPVYFNAVNALAAMYSNPFRAKAGTVIQYSVTYNAGGSCSPGPSYILYPILEELTAN